MVVEAEEGASNDDFYHAKIGQQEMNLKNSYKEICNLTLSLEEKKKETKKKYCIDSCTSWSLV